VVQFEEVYSLPEADWFGPVPEFRGHSWDVPPVGRRGGWEAVPLCCPHSVLPAWVARVEAEPSEAGLALRALRQRRLSRPVRFSLGHPGVRLEAQSGEPGQRKAVCRHCS